MESSAVTEKLRMKAGVADCRFRKFIHCREWTKSGVEMCSKEIKTQQLDWMTHEYALLIFRKSFVTTQNGWKQK